MAGGGLTLPLILSLQTQTRNPWPATYFLVYADANASSLSTASSPSTASNGPNTRTGTSTMVNKSTHRKSADGRGRTHSPPNTFPTKPRPETPGPPPISSSTPMPMLPVPALLVMVRIQGLVLVWYYLYTHRKSADGRGRTHSPPYTFPAKTQTRNPWPATYFLAYA